MTTLSRSIRIRIAQVGFVRAVVLRRMDVAQRLAPILSGLAPTMRRELALFEQAGDNTSRWRAAALLLIRTPGMKLALWGLDTDTTAAKSEPGRDYDLVEGFWWCKAEVTPQSDLTTFLFDNRVASPRFLSAEEQAAVARERRALEERASAPEFLIAEALAWAEQTPDDPLIPEILSRTIKGWRYAHCHLPTRSPQPRRAFTLLHTRYTKSPWALRTPYWYN